MHRLLPTLLLAIPGLISSSSAQEFAPTDECPLLGNEFPTDFDIEATDAFAEAKELFPSVIEKLFESGVVHGATSSFHIDVFSASTNKSIYSYSHQATAPARNETFPKGGIDDETIFRIGSVSKLFTVYSILAKAGTIEVFDDPITTYLPELAGNPRDDPLNKIVWEDITIGTLASHQGGVGMFPSYLLQCLTPGDPICNQADWLAYLKETRAPTQAIHRGGLYADGGFGILGLALDRMTGLRYGDAVGHVLGQPLKLNSTGTVMPTDENVNGVVIPMSAPGASGWGYDNQATAPSGGIYSNAADLRALGLSILHSKLIKPSHTRWWMKPRAHLSTLTGSLGAPWEIYRLTIPVSANSTRYRVSDLYSKAGGNPGYTAIFALSPDHNIGYSVLVAGSTAGGDRWPIRAAVGETFIVAAEHAAKEVAKRRYAGKFVGSNDSTNLTITVDENQPGLGVSEFFINGLNAGYNISLPGLTELPEGIEQVIRMYPTGLEETTEGGCKKIKYRAVAEAKPFAPRAKIEGGTGLFEDGCITWLSTSFFEDPPFGFYDDFILEVDPQGVLTSVEYPVRQLTLKRVVAE